MMAARDAAGAGTPPGGLADGAPIESATRCKSCHGGFKTDDGHTYMPWDTWAGSMMANAARDPLFLASVTVAEQDRPGSGSFCLRCHTPSAHLESRTTPGNGSALNDVDQEGVQCAVCHRSIDASQPPTSDPNAPYIGNAQLFFDVGTPGEVTYHGPYDDSPFSPAHNFVSDPFVARDDSRLCGQCHQVDNPDEHLYDASGNDTGRVFPLDTTYEEWEQSSFSSGAGAKSCQACHMPLESGAYPVGSGAGNRDAPPRHDFVGGNEWGPALLKAAFPGLRDEAYDYTRAATQANLRVAADLEIRALPTEGSAGGKIDLTVRVTNKTGHKFPTGYADGRRAWVEIAVVDSTGAVDVQSGEYDAATSTLVEDEQLRLYEALHGRDGQVEDHIVLSPSDHPRQPDSAGRLPPDADDADRGADQVFGRRGWHRQLRRRALPREASEHGRDRRHGARPAGVSVDGRVPHQGARGSQHHRRPGHEAAAALGADGQGGAVRDGGGHGQRPRRRAAAGRRRLRLHDGSGPAAGAAGGLRSLRLALGAAFRRRARR